MSLEHIFETGVMSGKNALPLLNLMYQINVALLSIRYKTFPKHFMKFQFKFQ